MTRTIERERLRLGSLFSGIGGFELAAERAGMDIAWSVEIDPIARSVLARHWPDVARYEDVREVGAHNLAPVDVITFGSPCQDLSVAGKRAGLAGERSGLFHEAIRIIRELRPAIAVWEQVPGVLSSHGGRDFGIALDALADCGAMDICWSVLDARYWRVAQRRRRVFTVVDFGGHRASTILALADGLSGHPAPGREERQGAPAGTGNGAGSGGGYSLTGDAFWRAGQCPLAASDDNGSNHVVATSVSRRGRADGTAELGGEVAYALSAAQGSMTAPTVLTETASAITASAGHHGHSSPRGDGSDNHVVVAEPLAYALNSHAGAADGEATNRSHAAGGPVGLGVSEEVAYALRSERTQAIAFTSKDYGGDVGTTSPTLRAMNYDQSHLNGGGQVAIFESRVARNGRGAPEAGRPPLKAQSGQTGKGDSAPLVFQQNQRNEVRLLPVTAQQAGALPAQPGMKQQNYVANAAVVRRLLPVECERLQGFPEVRQNVIIRVWESYSGPLLNHAPVDDQSLRLPRPASNVGSDELNSCASCAAQPSSPKPLPTERRVVAHVVIDYVRSTAALLSQGASSKHASDAASNDSCHPVVPSELTALANAPMPPIPAPTMPVGRAALQASSEHSGAAQSGAVVVNLSGPEINAPASDAGANGPKSSRRTTSITSEVGESSPTSDWIIRTFCCSVIHAIAGSIHAPTQPGSSYDVSLELISGWTAGHADSHRYRLLGNSVVVNVVEWLLRRVVAALEETS